MGTYVDFEILRTINIQIPSKIADLELGLLKKVTYKNKKKQKVLDSFKTPNQIALVHSFHLLCCFHVADEVKDSVRVSVLIVIP